MGFDKNGGHCRRIVKIGKATLGKRFADVQYGLGFFLDFLSVCPRRGFRPGEIVVNKFRRITIIGFESSANPPRPVHMHRRSQYAEMKQSRVLNE